MKAKLKPWTMLALTAVLVSPLGAMDEVRIETCADEATAAFGVTGQGVTIAILDRGIDWSHPDFVNPVTALPACRASPPTKWPPRRSSSS